MAIDSYIMDVRNPFEQSLAGVQTALQISGASRDRQLMEQRSRVFQAQEAAALAEAQAKQEQMKQDQAMQEEMAKVAANPTMANVRSMLIRFPSMKDSLGKAMESLSASERDARVRLAGQVNAAITAGRPDVAREIMTKQAEAYRNSNREDDAVETERFIQLMDASPGSVGALAGLMVASAGEGDKYVENLTKLEDERRAKDKAPFELAKLTAEAKVKELEAKFAPDKLAAELGLTKEQIEQAKAARRASDASARKSNADAARSEAESKQIGAGIIPAEKRPEAEAKLRKEYSDQTKAYQDVKAAYGRVKATNPDAAGDLSLIFNYMKMLDPGSTVREGEFATAQNAGGIDDKARNLYNRIVNGERLSEPQRKMFIGQANKLYKSALEQEQTVRSLSLIHI